MNNPVHGALHQLVKITIQIPSGSQGNGTEIAPRDWSRTASVLRRKEQILTGLREAPVVDCGDR